MTSLLGTSDGIERVRRRIAAVAGTPLPVLVCGETGTGKEVVARMLHEASGRSGPFVPVDCGALAQSLVESELFGHERGAFTGANARRDGLVHAAEGGTFFLDEVGELPMLAQTRLLRLLENGTYRPVGGTEQRAADLRIVAATWRDLQKRVADGSFREDLYHRLAIVELALPPLRDRQDDAILLFEHFMRESLPSDREVVPVLDPSARAWLARWPWAGNVRELRNTAQYVAAMVPGARIRREDLPPRLQGVPPEMPRETSSPTVDSLRLDLPYMEARRLFLDEFQFRYVEAQLDAAEGNISAAARAAGMDRRSIQRILARRRGGG